MTAVDVIVIGDALLDVTVEPDGPIRPSADVPAAIGVRCGGQGANLAVRLARRGLAIGLVCGLADDPAGELVTAAMQAEGVSVSSLPVERTGTVVILLDDAGERTMLSARAPFASAVIAAPIPAAPWTVSSGYLFLEPDAAGFARTLAGLDSRRVVVGCAVPDDLLVQWREAVLGARPELLILNRDEARALGPGLGPPVGTVVTGTDSVEASIGDVVVRIPVPNGAPAVDTTGAGDAFAASLVGGLMETPWPPAADGLEAVMGRAIALASQVARVEGAQARVAAESGATLRQ